jgi:hypothetical protein
MDVRIWKTPVEATWHRANRLVEVNTGLDELMVRIIEESTERIWTLQFSNVRAFKLLVEDCAEWSKKPLPPDHGFFVIRNSPWFRALGIGEADPGSPESVQHFVICMHEGVLEVAAHGCSFVG